MVAGQEPRRLEEGGVVIPSNSDRVCDRCSKPFDRRFPGQSVGTGIMHSHCLAAEIERLRAAIEEIQGLVYDSGLWYGDDLREVLAKLETPS